VVFKRETLTFDPSRVFVFVDEQEASIDDGHFLVWRAPDRRWINSRMPPAKSRLTSKPRNVHGQKLARAVGWS
jgi:hypothetical protein